MGGTDEIDSQGGVTMVSALVCRKWRPSAPIVQRCLDCGQTFKYALPEGDGTPHDSCSVYLALCCLLACRICADFGAFAVSPMSSVSRARIGSAALPSIRDAISLSTTAVSQAMVAAMSGAAASSGVTLYWHSSDCVAATGYEPVQKPPKHRGLTLTSCRPAQIEDCRARRDAPYVAS
jgi:hypothetical protein